MIALGCKFYVAWNTLTTFLYKESSDYFLFAMILVSTFLLKEFCDYFLLKRSHRLYLVGNNFVNNPMTTFFWNGPNVCTSLQIFGGMEFSDYLILQRIQWLLYFANNLATTFLCKESSDYFLVKWTQWLHLVDFFFVAWNPVTTFFYEESSDYSPLQRF